MKNNCIICKRRKTCTSYLLGGPLVDTYCNRFQEEKDISEEEQIISDNKFKEENSVKNYKPIIIVVGLITITILACILLQNIVN